MKNKKNTFILFRHGKKQDEGETVSVESLNVTANGTYSAGTNKAYNPVTVNVQPITIDWDSVNFCGDGVGGYSETFKYYCSLQRGQIVNIQKQGDFVGIYVLFSSPITSCSYPNSQFTGAGLLIGLDEVCKETQFEVTTADGVTCHCFVYNAKSDRDSREVF